MKLNDNQAAILNMLLMDKLESLEGEFISLHPVNKNNKDDFLDCKQDLEDVTSLLNQLYESRTK